MTFKFQDTVSCMFVHDMFTVTICNWNEMPCMFCSRLEFQLWPLPMAVIGHWQWPMFGVFWASHCMLQMHDFQFQRVYYHIYPNINYPEHKTTFSQISKFSGKCVYHYYNWASLHFSEVLYSGVKQSCSDVSVISITSPSKTIVYSFIIKNTTGWLQLKLHHHAHILWVARCEEIVISYKLHYSLCCSFHVFFSVHSFLKCRKFHICSHQMFHTLTLLHPDWCRTSRQWRKFTVLHRGGTAGVLGWENSPSIWQVARHGGTTCKKRKYVCCL